MQINQREKAERLYGKAEDAAKRISAQAGNVKKAIKRQYDISAMKAKVIRLELSLKKDFEKAGEAIYAQCEAAGEDMSDRTDRVLALFAEIDSKRDLIREMRACIMSMEDDAEELPLCVDDMTLWNDEDDEALEEAKTEAAPDFEAGQEDME